MSVEPEKTRSDQPSIYQLQELQNQHAKLKQAHEKDLSEHLKTQAALTASNTKLSAANSELEKLRGKPFTPTDIQQAILLIVARVESMTTEEIMTSLKLSKHMVDHHLAQLEEAKMIYSDPVTFGTPLDWMLMSAGREYFIERDLLK